MRDDSTNGLSADWTVGLPEPPKEHEQATDEKIAKVVDILAALKDALDASQRKEQG